MKLFHQCGHNTVWNRKALEFGSGDGLILSPVHVGSEKVRDLSLGDRSVSLFDPQYYLPNSQKEKLHTYSFYPELIADGFTTLDFSQLAHDSAKQCVEFQLENEFESILIPVRHFEQMVSGYIDRQESYSVLPFLSEISRQGVSRPVYLTVVLTSHMLIDERFRVSVLNWITGFPEISGVYLVLDCPRGTKQIGSKDLLLEGLNFIASIVESGMRIILGYSNTESLLYSVAGDIDIAMGAYENTRIFSLDKFLSSTNDMRGPRARIYLPGLLNWIEYSQAKDIKNDAPEIWNKVHVTTDYSERVLAQLVEPKFNQSPLYMHYFSVFSRQAKELDKLNQLDRYKKLSEWLVDAMNYNEQILDLPIALEKHGRGDHLQPWLDALNSFYRKKLKA